MGLAQINIRFKADLKQFSTEMQNAGREMEKIGSKMQTIGATMSAAITLPLVAMGAAAYNMAADFEDALGATDQIFKQASEATAQWANALPTYYGIAKKEALEYSNMMGSMLKNIGNLTEQEASQQSAKLIELAGDLTAMYGGTTADAVRALTGALKGNNTMLDNYGMAANDAMVKTKAMEMGLLKQGQTMTLATKQAATLALIYEQSAAAQGQAAREADGASGSMRALKTELTNVATEFGQHLLPIITPIVQGLRDMMERFRDLDPAMKQVIVVGAAVLAAVGPLIAIFGTFAAMLPSIIAGVGSMGAAFTIMTGPVGLVIAGVAALIALIVANWDEVKKTLVDTANYWIDLYNESMLFRAAVQYVILMFKQLGNAVVLVFNLASSIVKNFWNQLKTIFGNMGDLLKAIFTGDFKAIPEIVGRQFKETFGNAKNMLSDFKDDFVKFGNDTGKVVNEAIGKAFKDRRAKITADTTTVKKDITTATVAGLNDGVENFNKTGKKVKIEIEPVTGSVGYYDKIISEIEKAQKNNATDAGLFETFQQKIDEYKKLRDAITGDLKQEIVVGSEAWYQQEIDGLNKLIPNLEAGSEAYFNLVKQREILQKTLEMAQTIPAPVMPEPEQGTVDWYNYHINKLKEARDAAGITVEEFKRLSNEINILETTFKMEVEVEGADKMAEVTERSKEMQAVMSGVSQGITDSFALISEGIGNSMGEAKTNGERFNQEMTKIIVKLMAQTLAGAMSNAILTGTSFGASLGPAGIAAIPAAIASMMALVVGSFAGIPKFANGGIVSGPVMGLMGEYAGARNNPEVIAPLNKLKDLIEPAGGATNVTVQLAGGWRVQGNDLITVLDRVEKINSRKR